MYVKNLVKLKKNEEWFFTSNQDSTIALYFFSACEIGIIFYGNIVQVQVQAVQTFSHILFDISLGIQLLLNKWHKLFDNQYL